MLRSSEDFSLKLISIILILAKLKNISSHEITDYLFPHVCCWGRRGGDTLKFGRGYARMSNTCIMCVYWDGEYSTQTDKHLCYYV